MPEKETTDQRWNRIAQKMLVGKKIKAVSYMTQKEASSMGWCKRPVIIELDDGSHFFPSADDEGNDGGALFTSDKDNPTLPVL